MIMAKTRAQPPVTSFIPAIQQMNQPNKSFGQLAISTEEPALASRIRLRPVNQGG
jgi:hypothetical protein